jgi:hypothetical protein
MAIRLPPEVIRWLSQGQAGQARIKRAREILLSAYAAHLAQEAQGPELTSDPGPVRRPVGRPRALTPEAPFDLRHLPYAEGPEPNQGPDQPPCSAQ